MCLEHAHCSLTFCSLNTTQMLPPPHPPPNTTHSNTHPPTHTHTLQLVAAVRITMGVYLVSCHKCCCLFPQNKAAVCSSAVLIMNQQIEFHLSETDYPGYLCNFGQQSLALCIPYSLSNIILTCSCCILRFNDTRFMIFFFC